MKQENSSHSDYFGVDNTLVLVAAHLLTTFLMSWIGVVMFGIFLMPLLLLAILGYTVALIAVAHEWLPRRKVLGTIVGLLGAVLYVGGNGHVSLAESLRVEYLGTTIEPYHNALYGLLPVAGATLIVALVTRRKLHGGLYAFLVTSTAASPLIVILVVRAIGAIGLPFSA